MARYTIDLSTRHMCVTRRLLFIYHFKKTYTDRSHDFTNSIIKLLVMVALTLRSTRFYLDIPRILSLIHI